MDTNVLPKGHIIGWAPPPSSANKPGAGSGSTSLSKNAKKRQKQKEKKAEAVKDNWEDEDEAQGGGKAPVMKQPTSTSGATSDAGKGDSGTHTPDQPNWAVAPTSEKQDDTADGLASELEKLEVK